MAKPSTLQKALKIQRLKKSEEQECRALVDYIDLMANIDWRWSMIFHVGNERFGYKQGLRAKLMGTRKGVPDYVIDYPCGIYHGMRLEMKAGKSKPTAEQLSWLARYKQIGMHTAVCWSADDAIAELTKYFALKPYETLNRCQSLTSAPSNVIPLRK